MSIVHIQNDEYLVKLFYLSPILAKPGQQVTQGQAIGTAQKISTKYGSGMIHYVQGEMWLNSILVLSCSTTIVPYNLKK